YHALALDDDFVVGVQIGQAASAGQRVRYIVVIRGQIDDKAGVALAARKRSVGTDVKSSRLLTIHEDLLLPLMHERDDKPFPRLRGKIGLGVEVPDRVTRLGNRQAPDR